MEAVRKEAGMRWYVLHVYSGFENKVAEAIMEKARKKGFDTFVSETCSSSLKEKRLFYFSKLANTDCY